jgi:hypothetical protein
MNSRGSQDLHIKTKTKGYRDLSFQRIKKMVPIGIGPIQDFN